MQALTAIFDIGKTNKKFLLFDEGFRIVKEVSIHPDDSADEDGFPCEDLPRLMSWMQQTWDEARRTPDYQIRSLNFTTYGASFVHLDADGHPVAPLYNYLKPLPPDVRDQFYADYGPADQLARETASPALDLLNSGLQLYWLKQARPDVFAQIHISLHLPQFCSFLFTGHQASELTSIGCHTALWDYDQNTYHRWVNAEGIAPLFPPLALGTKRLELEGGLIAGVGLHDSSASLVPYLKTIEEPFLLISTGTWSITMNPFSDDPLTPELLAQDCLNFLTYEGKTVRASRLFLGYEHESRVKQLEADFHQKPDSYKWVRFNPTYLKPAAQPKAVQTSVLSETEEEQPPTPATFEEAYHQLVMELVALQLHALQLAQGTTVARKVIVTGGFCHNEIFLKGLASLLPDQEVYISDLPHATAIGAALVLQETLSPEVRAAITPLTKIEKLAL
ncbi:Sugar (pentulose or hexulose) kinase [Catalinimonas alkaloidigena]|uniref:Sugar (Pentulose or hexulose) kinase n=1 Tax=Catalinimonas alkaloidigena TaxID=1075417 RepID=A0A1G9KKP1_9BACT|nr:FGGY family carbohydrate kinase [Catalinimonas alkaloidigena]SDL50358.1 Sugar (pentulose or hexulose) kinase [Catalinimonas alkaloidigena]